MGLTGFLARCKLIAILRGVKPEEVEAIAAALESQGIAIVEVPLNSPRPLDSIARLARRFGDRLLIGAGSRRRLPERRDTGHHTTVLARP